MLVLFDTPAGHALFKVLDPSKLEKPDGLFDCFESLDTTRKLCAGPISPRTPPLRVLRGAC